MYSFVIVSLEIPFSLPKSFHWDTKHTGVVTRREGEGEKGANLMYYLTFKKNLKRVINCSFCIY